MHKMIGWKMDVKNGRGVRGEATAGELHGVLRRFAKIATAKMKKTDADHVLYGIKTYDKNGSICGVRFFMDPMSDEDYERMTDEEFSKAAKRSGSVLIYAVHSRRKLFEI